MTHSQHAFVIIYYTFKHVHLIYDSSKYISSDIEALWNLKDRITSRRNHFYLVLKFLKGTVQCQLGTQAHRLYLNKCRPVFENYFTSDAMPRLFKGVFKGVNLKNE
jgi:hypothetical protein